MTLDDLKDKIASVTHARMRAVARRIRRVVVTRSFCVAVIVLLTLTFAAIASDYYFGLTLLARWVVWTIGLLATVIACLATSRLHLQRLASVAWLARVIESVSPALKNRLLSSLELSIDTGRGSKDLASLLHTQVASYMESVSPKHVLRWSTIRTWILSASILAMAFSVCFFVPNIGWAKQVGRIWWPSSNVGRVTHLNLVIKPPASPWIEVRAEMFAVRAEVILGSTDAVTLQVKDQSGAITNNSMHRRVGTSQDFIQNVNIDQTTVSVRAVSGGAESPWYEITLVNRPELKPASISYTFPQYAKTPPKEVQPWDGNVHCVAGTVARLNFTSEQTIQIGSLKFDWESPILIAYGNPSPTELLDKVSLTLRGGGHLEATLPILSDGSYIIEAIDDGTQKSSDTTLRYQIVGNEDAPPRIEIRTDADDSGTSMTRWLKRYAMIEFNIDVADEFMVDQIALQWRSDQTEWKTIALSGAVIDPDSSENTSLQITRSQYTLDPLALIGRDARLIEVRAEATDRLGLHTVSPPMRWLIAQQVVTADMWQQLDRRFALSNEINQATDAWQIWYEAAVKARDEADFDAKLTLRKCPLTLDMLRRWSVQYGEIYGASTDWVEQSAALNMLARAERMAAYDLPSLLLTGKQYAASKTESTDAFKRSLETTRVALLQLKETDESLFTLDVMLASGLAMDSIREAQSQLNETLDILNEQQISSRQFAIGEILNDLLNRVTSYSRAFATNNRNSLNSNLKNLRQLEPSLRSLRDSGEKEQTNLSKSQLQPLVSTLNQRLNQLQNLSTMFNSLFDQYNERRKAVSQTWSLSTFALQQTLDALQEIERARDPLAKLKLVQTLDSSNKIANQILEQTRLLEAQRLTIDRGYVADLGNISRAMKFIFENQSSTTRMSYDQLREAMQEIVPAVKVLSVANLLQQTKSSLANLESIETDFNSSKAVLRIMQPRNYRDVQYHFEFLDRQINDTEALRTLGQYLNPVRWSPSVQEASQMIDKRRWSNEAVKQVGIQLQQQMQLWEPLQTNMQPAIDAARVTIGKYVPSIVALAQETKLAAETTEQVLHRHDRAAADANADNTLDSKIEEVLKAERETQDKLAEVAKALQDMAAVQDLLTPEEARRAEDADAALAALEQQSEASQAAMKQLASNQPEAKNEAIQSQQSLQELMQQIDDHFSQPAAANSPKPNFTQSAKSAQNASANQTPTTQSQTAKPTTGEAPNEQAYSEAQMLQSLAALSPEAILKQLEEALEQRPEMQAALAQLAAAQASQSGDSIENAADQQLDMVKDLERNNAVMQAEKSAIVEQLQQLQGWNSKLIDQDFNWLQQLLERSQLKELREKFNQIREQAAAINSDIANVSNDQPLSHLSKSTQQIVEQITAAQASLTRQAELVKTAAPEPTTSDEKQLKNLNREAEEWQKRFNREEGNWADNETRRREGQVNNLKGNQENRERQVQKTEKRLQDQKDRAAKDKPENRERYGIRQAELDVNQAKQNLAAAQINLATSQIQVESTRELTELVKNQDSIKIENQTPHYSLAQSRAQRATQFADTIANQARQVAAKLDAIEHAEVSANTARSITEREQNLATQLTTTKTNLERVQRHANRLDNEAAAKAITSITSEKLPAAAKSLEALADKIETLRQPTEGKTTPANSNEPLPATVAKSLGTTLEKAEQELRDMVPGLLPGTKQLRQQAEQTDARKPARSQTLQLNNKSMDQSSAADQISQYLSEPEMAELLDDLDKVVFANAKSEKSGTSQSAASNASNSKAQQNQAFQSSADKLADLLAQKRMLPDKSDPESQNNSSNQPSQSSRKSASKSSSSSSAAQDVETQDAGEGIGNSDGPAGVGGVDANWARLRESRLEQSQSQQRGTEDSPDQESINAYFRALSQLRAIQ